MLKIISAEKIRMSANSEKIKLYSRYSVLFFVLEGTVFINKERTEAGTGCLADDMVNTYIKSDKDQSCSLVRFELDGKDTEKLLEMHGLSSHSPTSRFSVSNPTRCAEFARLLCADTELLGNTAFCEAAAKLLLSFTKAEAAAEYTSAYGNIHVDRAVRYIDGNLAGELRVEQIAEMLGIDRMYLRNLFAQYAGMSTMEYIMSKRMERAKELLANERMSVGEVASSVGYPDVLAFSKTFKKHVGVSPTDFRKGIKKEAPVKRAKKDDVPIFIL